MLELGSDPDIDTVMTALSVNTTIVRLLRLGSPSTDESPLRRSF